MIHDRVSDTYGTSRFRADAARVLALVANARTLDEAREILSTHVSSEQYEANQSVATPEGSILHVVRDCARALRGMLHRRAEVRSEFSVAQALWDLATNKVRPELSAGFFAELTQLVMGLEGRFSGAPSTPNNGAEGLHGREAAVQRSDELDALWAKVETRMSSYPDGLGEDAQQRRAQRREQVLNVLGARREEFEDWRWQVGHIAREAGELARLVPLADGEREAIDRARRGKLPLGVTPYYASLMDDEPTLRDRALRAQVIPPLEYVEHMVAHRGDKSCSFDFMLEHDTSPVPLITRRYPAIVIFKPFNTCPQICVYCQRNWEIDDAMVGGALASHDAMEQAFSFLEGHPAIREVLVTGGDPLGLPDEQLLPILERLAAIPHIDVLRIGTRTPVTLPMRITSELAAGLGKLRAPGRREIEVVTHVEHPYEVTPDLVGAVDRLRRNGIPVYNQLVYSFFVSRRFEAAKLRMILKRAGIDPYYTFAPKGKAETRAYRVPLARILQEQKEEARLLPGSRRTDEPVYNVPGLGKNHLRAFQHRDLISILPNGARVYDFHPWEKGIAARDSYVGEDVPILEYLQRLQDIGEDPDEYASIWYYF